MDKDEQLPSFSKKKWVSARDVRSDAELVSVQRQEIAEKTTVNGLGQDGH